MLIAQVAPSASIEDGRVDCMAQIRHLARAPIVEALIDLRIHAAETVTVEALEKALDHRNFGYRKKGPILRGHFGIMINPTETPPAQSMHGSSAIIGTRLHSTDDKYVAQFTTEGFTLSRLEPYDSWERLVEEAKRVWVEYMGCVAPTQIHRTATRYINNLRLPMTSGDRFERFLTAMPNMPPDFPQVCSSFLQRFVVEDEICGATAILTQALEQFTPKPPVPVIIDIDVFRETRFAPDGAEVWDFLDTLRGLKNRFFFGMLTEQAVSLYT
jgi:uncharacterized protein (TIGR04255 family)